LPGPPQRPTITDPEHPAVAAFRGTVERIHRALARVVDIHHIDEATAAQLTAVGTQVADLHASLDAVDAAWLAEHSTQVEG
jgi:hypothetical protein